MHDVERYSIMTMCAVKVYDYSVWHTAEQCIQSTSFRVTHMMDSMWKGCQQCLEEEDSASQVVSRS